MNLPPVPPLIVVHAEHLAGLAGLFQIDPPCLTSMDGENEITEESRAEILHMLGLVLAQVEIPEHRESSQAAVDQLRAYAKALDGRYDPNCYSPTFEVVRTINNYTLPTLLAELDDTAAKTRNHVLPSFELNPSGQAKIALAMQQARADADEGSFFEVLVDEPAKAGLPENASVQANEDGQDFDDAEIAENETGRLRLPEFEETKQKSFKRDG